MDVPKIASVVAGSTQLEQHPMLLGESYGFWCQTATLLLAAVFAYISIRSSRAIERRKAAAGVIFSTRKDSELLGCIEHIGRIVKSGQNIAIFAELEKIDSAETKSIRYALNHWEYIAVGISQGIYDEQIFKSSSYTTVVRLYENTKPYMVTRRRVTGRNTHYQEFECLACEWIENPLQHKPIKSVRR